MLGSGFGGGASTADSAVSGAQAGSVGDGTARPRPGTNSDPSLLSAPSPTDAATPVPAPVPPAEVAPAPVSGDVGAADAVLAIVNEQRASAGCAAVAADPGLAGVASAHSADMAARDFFDHTNPDGQSPWDRAGAAGISYAGGENIALGQADAAAAMDAWMNSPGHRANIVNCEFTKLGTGVHDGPGGPWWTQLFGY
ncbi:hypothetical protein ASE14_00985 [Agromyces sp. Root81]|nr:hypothetical protein ASE14_00985 [Agromyces sp. Root81]